MEKFYKTAMKLKKHKKILSALTLASTPHETINLLITNNTAIGATSLLLSVLPDTPVELISYIPVGFLIAILGKKIENKSLVYTDEYFTAFEEYKNYITDLANIFKSQDINDPISVSYIFTNLLITGLLSYDDPKFEDKIRIPKKEKCPELLGTKVMDGTTFSRYSASLLCDTLNMLGHNSCILSLETKGENEASHTVVGIIHNNKKFAYDLTNADLLYTNKSATVYISKNSKKDNKPVEYTIELDESYSLNKSRMTNFIQYKMCKPETDELIIFDRELSTAIASLAITTEMASFNKKHKNQMQKIKTLSDRLYPNRNLPTKD